MISVLRTGFQQAKRQVVKFMTAGLLGILITGCGGGDSQDPDPVVVDLAIAYVKRPVPLNNGNPVQPDARTLTTINPGADLWVRDRASSSAPATNITINQTLLDPTDPTSPSMGDVKDVEVSYDGSMILFAMREPDRATDVQTPTWNIWVYDIKTKILKRVITDDITAEAGEDQAPHFLPDGKIIFTSTRQSASKIILTDEGPINNNNKSAFVYRDESRQETAFVLHIMNVDCTTFATCGINSNSDITQVSFNQSHDLTPTVLQSGKIIFTRWDHAGGRNAMHIYQSNPDGTEMKLVYGRQSHATGTNGATVQFLQPREMSDGRLLTILQPFTGTFGGGDIFTLDIKNYTDSTRTIVPSQLTGTAGQASLVNNNIFTDTSPSPGGRYSAAYPLWDGTNRILVSWTPCRLTDGNIILACNPTRLADNTLTEATPLYGLYVFDPTTRTQLPIFPAEENFIYTDIVVAQNRVQEGTRPAVITVKTPGIDPELDLTLAGNGTGVLHIRSVYDRDGIFNNLGMATTAAATLNTLATTDPDGLSGTYGFSLDNRQIAYLADPSRFTSDDRPARFLRIVKAVSMPDQLNGAPFNIDNDAFGQSNQQGMREIIGYVPIQPDGSVMAEVPANVALAISVVDKFGRRISARHLSWIQVKPGESVTCSGCHQATPSTVNPADGIHGHSREPVGVNAGAPADGYNFPGTMTNPLVLGDTINGQTTGQTMAQAYHGDFCKTRSCKPDFDIDFIDIWTNGAEAAFSYEYRNFIIGEVVPLNVGVNACYNDTSKTNNWNATCRVIINYPESIQQIWDATRGVAGADTCTGCHTAANNRLDLTNTANGNLLLSYTDLFNGRTVQQQAVDSACNPLTITIQVPLVPPDPMNPGATMPMIIPDIRPFTIPAQFSVNGARSSIFFDRFTTDAVCQTVDHKSMLSADEKRFLYEWLDIGGQFYNDPTNINVPVN